LTPQIFLLSVSSERVATTNTGDHAVQSNTIVSVAEATSEASMYKKFLEYFGGRENINKMIAANRVQALLNGGKAVTEILSILATERLYVPYVESAVRQALEDFVAEADDLVSVQPTSTSLSSPEQSTALVPVKTPPAPRQTLPQSGKHQAKTVQGISRIISFVGQQTTLVNSRTIFTELNTAFPSRW
jgi:hypothetical protein